MNTMNTVQDTSLLKKDVSNLRDGQLSSAWFTAPALEISTVNNPAQIYDALIIGGGITGITAALMLQKEGKNCIIAEAHTIGFGTTGGTSAHINTFADTTYDEAESAFGQEGAQLFADAIIEGSRIIKSNIDTYTIDCDYEAKKGFIYAANTDEAKQLEDIYEGTKKVGVNINYTENVPTPLSYIKAVVLDGQAQFHPIKYINALAEEFIKAGGVILEFARVNELSKEGEIHIAKTGEQTIRAQKIIYATHIPPGLTTFNFRCAPYRSYVLGVKLKGDNYPDALIYDMQDPYHYFRTHVIDGQSLLLVGGDDHKTGHDDPETAFNKLETYVREHYPVSFIKYRWSSQYYIPADGFPYIGQMPEMAEGIYCATGYNGNGMMFGTIAAKILSDVILDKPNKYEKIFSPGRIKPVAGFTDFIKENADAVYHFVADRFNLKDIGSLKNLTSGNGEIIELDDKKIAAYKDADGKIHAVNAVCTHAKCIVNWNTEEKSWDCPCHGARYDVDGKILNGPATVDLELIDLQKDTD